MRLPKLLASNPKASAGIIAFIVLIVALLWAGLARAAPPQALLRGGAAYGAGGIAPVLALDLRFPQDGRLDLIAGTMLWGETPRAATNWDWHGGFRACRGNLCASLGASYLQRADALNGSHAEFYLGLSWLLGLGRLDGVSLAHLSNAGTTDPNLGRNAATLDVRLR